MFELVLLISIALQWVALLGLLALVVTLIHLLRRSRDEGSLSLGSLKGVNIANEGIFDVRNDRQLFIRDILRNKPLLLVVTDPTCSTCLHALRTIVSHDTFRPESSVIAVRGNEETVREFANSEAKQCLVVQEHRGLGLTAFKPPFATVLDRTGTYVASVTLEESGSADSVLAILETERALNNERPLPLVDGEPVKAI